MALRGLIHLKGCATPKRTSQTGNTKNNGQDFPKKRVPFPGKACFQVLHRSAHKMTVFPFLPKHDSQSTFRELCAHPQNTGHNHPKHSPRTANGNSHRHSGNIPQTHCCRKSRGQSLKMAYLPLLTPFVVLSRNHINGMFKEANIHKIHFQSKEHGKKQEKSAEKRNLQTF